MFKRLFQTMLERLGGATELEIVSSPAPPASSATPIPVSAPDLSTFRQPSWEEDISLHHDSIEPFENAAAPCEMPAEAFNIWSRVSEELLAGQAISDFIARDSYPIPHARDREGYQVNFDARYFLNGLADYLKIQQAIQRHRTVPGGEIDSYFDFGCASGRVLRQFCAHSNVKNLWGCDINGRHVKWINDHLPANLKIIHSHGLTHLPIASNSIDVISAFSVFTHIDTFETGWIAELHRILRPGGMAYLTVHNDATWEHLRNAHANSENEFLLHRLCQIQPAFREMLDRAIPAGRTVFRYTDVGPYRALTFHSNEYLNKTWGRFFKIVEVVPKGHGICQSVLIGIKE